MAGQSALKWPRHRWVLGVVGGLLLPAAVVGLGALVLDEFLSTPLIRAAKSGNADEAKRLLGSGARVDQRGGINGYSALYKAALNGHVDVVRLLLDAGAEVNDPGEMDSGETPLIGACRRGHIEVARLLLQRAADPNRKDFRGTSPLSASTEQSRTDIVALLKEWGATQ